VQWIKFQAEVIKRNCCIGYINMCDWLQFGDHPKMSPFISFSDLQPSRFALSYIEETNHNAYKVQVAFIAIDSENLGELVNDKYHTDFGDNKFPYYRGNTNVRLHHKVSAENGDSDSEDSDSSEDKDVDAFTDIDKYIPKSILRYTMS
jgi:hypothetical protein